MKKQTKPSLAYRLGYLSAAFVKFVVRTALTGAIIYTVFRCMDLLFTR